MREANPCGDGGGKRLSSESCPFPLAGGTWDVDPSSLRSRAFLPAWFVSPAWVVGIAARFVSVSDDLEHLQAPPFTMTRPLRKFLVRFIFSVQFREIVAENEGELRKWKKFEHMLTEGLQRYAWCVVHL